MSINIRRLKDSFLSLQDALDDAVASGYAGTRTIQAIEKAIEWAKSDLVEAKRDRK